MTDTLVGVSPLRKAGKKTLTPEEAERAAVRELVKAARARGDDLTGPDGLLKAITKQVIEAALEEEMTEHVGYDKHARGRAQWRQLQERDSFEDGADRQRRPGRCRGSAGPGGQLRAGHRQEAPAALE
jgi:hypothetical protein